MKFSRKSFKAMCAAALFTAVSSASQAVVIFKDGFETGDFSAKTGNAGWTAKRPEVYVSRDRAKTGSYSAQFHYVGNPTGSTSGGGFWSELNYDLGQMYPEVWVSFAMYVPANYAHRSLAGSANNNKIFRIWGNSYSDVEKVGYSTFPYAGDSDMNAEWNLNGLGIGSKGTPAQYFFNSYRGQWVNIKMRFKASTGLTSPAVMQFWKNGVLVMSQTNILGNFVSSEAHAYRYGYIFGTANSGFAQTTDFYIDDVVFATTEAELTGSSGGVASAPSAPVLKVEAR